MLPLLGVVALLLVLGGVWLYSVVSEVGFFGLLHGNSSTVNKYVVHLKEQPVYRVKKKQELLGINVIRIISKRQPEEFLVLDGVSRKLVDKIYGKPVDLPWANLIANQFIKLREGGEDGSPLSVDIQQVKTVRAEQIKMGGRKLPYWEIQVRFKLSNESGPREYSAIVVRNVRESSTPGDPESLVVGYAQKEAFQKELVVDLLKDLQFERT